jgi:hypothetical protein
MRTNEENHKSFIDPDFFKTITLAGDINGLGSLDSD